MAKKMKNTIEDASAREVARRAGVSLSTVSRVFRGSSLVSDSTTRKVREAAAEVGYQPSSSARSLRMGISNTVGYILRSPTGLLGEFHAKAFAAIEQSLAPRGLQALVTSIPAQTNLADFVRHLMLQESLCALVIQGDELSAGHTAELAEIPRPIVLLNHHRAVPSAEGSILSVGFDNRDGAIQAARHLAALGHRCIGFIGGTPTTNDAREREIGFREAMASLGLETKESWIRQGHFGEVSGGFRSGSIQMDFLLAERPQRPTAVIAASDEIAVGALESARRCGLSIPDDLSLIGFDNHSWSAYTHPPLTTIHHDGWQLGLCAARKLHELLSGKKQDERIEVLPVQLIARESSGRVPVTNPEITMA